MQGFIIYEHPLSERIRTMLRLEHLFRQAAHFSKGQTSWDSRIFLATLLDILDIFSRGDLKTELLKEIERSTGMLKGLMENPNVDHARLGTILRALEHIIDNLHGLSSQPGQSLRDDEFITGIRQRSSIPGGTCDFDLPAYHRWLEQPWQLREADQKRWFTSLDAVRQGVELLLKMIRNSAEFRSLATDNGSHQKQLESNLPYQMIRVVLPSDSPYYAEISGSKHRFSIRFLQPGRERPQLAEEPVEFKLACCSL
jgi:cell division protein ZapD